jgi:sec-independent protein translocase protein TatC
MSNPENTDEMPLIAHIEELRRVIIRCILTLIVCAVPCGIFWREIFNFVAILPLRLTSQTPLIIYTAPAETIMFSFKIALTGGIIFASPFIFYQIWSFAAPGLYKKEKNIILPVVFASSFCFLAGIAFAYFLLPLLLKFLTEFAPENINPYFRIDEYFAFLIKICLAFGIAFELPVVSFVLAKMGIIDHKFLIKYFRHAIVLIFIVAAILTPPDVLSQVLLAIPLVGLYGISILIVNIFGVKK